MKQFTVTWLLVLCSNLNSLPLTAQTVDYARDIQPLLAEKCAACHGALRQEAGLRLDHGQLLRQGGDSGSVIAEQSPSQSELLLRVSSDDASLRMPPEGQGEPLDVEQIALLSAWLMQGAPSPENELIPAPPEAHWAWQVPVQAKLPDVDDPDWSLHPIDRFIMAKLAENGLQPVPLADPQTRLRRLYFDAVGLPPTLEEQRAFLNDLSTDDSSTAVWSQWVDRLLRNPAHGERWARHWMDVWRYSDWDGYKQELRSSQRHIWRWRDWIVQSLNADKGYDRMLVEMLAGDEIAPLDSDVLRATGFLARNYHKSNRDIWLDATVEHTAKAFLGLTVACARCHDHKYDPLSQQEYYAFRAIFEPHQVRTERLAGQADLLKDGLARTFDATLDAPTYVYLAGNEKTPDREHPIPPAVPQVIPVPFEVTPVDLPPQAIFPALAQFIRDEDFATAEKKVAESQKSLVSLAPEANALDHILAEQKVVTLQAEFASLRARWSADVARYGAQSDSESQQSIDSLSTAAVSAEHQAKIEKAKLTTYEKELALAKALTDSPASSQSKSAKTDDSREQTIAAAHKALEEARAALVASNVPPTDAARYTSVGTAYPTSSTGRRSALARSIADRRNPLTARVAVNHLWLHYFGQPLVENMSDFGLRSPQPAQHALLDWLAVELMEHDWSLKHVQRLILTSLVYQLSSQATDKVLVNNQQTDPDNRLLWRGTVRRLDAEAVRDSLLCVGGTLDRTQGGPEIDFELGETTPRRSLYFRHAYEKQMTMLVLFDAAGPQECYRRSESIIPQQALALSNSPLSIDQARLLAHKLWEDAGEQLCCDALENGTTTGDPNHRAPAERRQITLIELAFQTLLCRECTPEELHTCQAFLSKQTQLLSDASKLHKLPGEQTGQTQAAIDPAARARENLIHTLLNHNDFVSLR